MVFGGVLFLNLFLYLRDGPVEREKTLATLSQLRGLAARSERTGVLGGIDPRVVDGNPSLGSARFIRTAQLA
jgi:hypothetical protein